MFDRGSRERGRAFASDFQKTRQADPEASERAVTALLRVAQDGLAEATTMIERTNTTRSRGEYERSKGSATKLIENAKQAQSRASHDATTAGKQTEVEECGAALADAATRLAEIVERRDAAIAKWTASQPVHQSGKLTMRQLMADRMPDIDPDPATGSSDATVATDRDAPSTGDSPDPPTALPHRGAMEATFGRDFSNVTANVGVASLRPELGADAVAQGNEIAFADHDPSPALVAHELTHVVQQEAAGDPALAASGVIASAGEAAEVEADAVAAHVATGGRGPVQVSARPSAGLHLQRSDGYSINRDPTGAGLRENIGKRLEGIERRVASLPETASAFRAAVSQLEMEGVIELGMSLVETVRKVDRDLPWIADDIELADQAGLGLDPTAQAQDAVNKSQTIGRLRERHAGVQASLLAYRLLVGAFVQPTAFRGQPIPGALPHPAPVDPQGFGAFVQREVARATVLVSTIDEVRLGLALLDPGDEPPRDLVDVVESWMGDRAGFLFLNHALEELGLSAMLNAGTRNGKTLADRATQVSAGVPQLAADIPATLERAKDASDAGDFTTASELTGLALIRMRELGDERRIRDMVDQGGGGGGAYEQQLFIVQEAETYASAAQRDVGRGQSPKANLLLAIRTASAATTIYQYVSGEADYASSAFAHHNDYMTVSVGLSVATLAVIAAPVLVPAMIEGAAAAYTELSIAAAGSPELALEVMMFAATIGLQIGEGGVDNFLASLQTRDGLIQLTIDLMSMRLAKGFGGVDDGAPQTQRQGASDPSGAGDVRARITDIGDRIRAFALGTLDWSKARARAKMGPGAATDTGAVVHGGAEGGDFHAHYQRRADEIRQARVSAGMVTYRPTPEQRLAGYHPPKPGKSVEDVRRQLAAEAREHAPVHDGMTNEERAAAFRKQAEYFERVEEQARQEMYRLAMEGDRIPSASRADKKEWLSFEYDAANLMVAAARAKPVAGSLPRSHAHAGREYKIEDIIAKKLETGPDIAEQAIREIEARGRTGIDFTPAGHPDLEPYVYRNGDVLGEVQIELTGARGTDFTACNEKMRAKYGQWKQPKGWTWHHHESEGRMILVPMSVHSVVPHTGGVAAFRDRTGDTSAYAKDGDE